MSGEVEGMDLTKERQQRQEKEEETSDELHLSFRAALGESQKRMTRGEKRKQKHNTQHETRRRSSEGREGMDVLIPHLINKQEVDFVIQKVLDKIVVIRFGDATEINCIHLDTIVCGPRERERE